MAGWQKTESEKYVEKQLFEWVFQAPAKQIPAVPLPSPSADGAPQSTPENGR
jgi:hypothetical protein